MYAKAQVIGNLGRDAETRYTKSGSMNVRSRSLLPGDSPMHPARSRSEPHGSG